MKQIEGEKGEIVFFEGSMIGDRTSLLSANVMGKTRQEIATGDSDNSRSNDDRAV